MDLYELATELHGELDIIGIIAQLKETPQLGLIQVNKKHKKSRYDYIMLQLYFHQLVKQNLQNQLKLSYNNSIKAKEFSSKIEYNYKKDKVTIADLLQLLVIVYNIGHFKNTFTASRAAAMYADYSDEFRQSLVYAVDDQRFSVAANTILDKKNYQRFHLLNSLIILGRCDQTKLSIQLAQELLYAYLNEDGLDGDSKLHYIFDLFRSIRSVAYVAYDLQIANTPFTIDLCNPKLLLVLLKEFLSAYNDTRSTKQLIDSISKMLDDTIYHEDSNGICYYMISRKMVQDLRNSALPAEINYCTDYFLNSESVFHKTYSRRKDYVQEGILKLTFSPQDRAISQNLFARLERLNGTSVGYYDRHNGCQTLLISLKTNCAKKPKVAMRVLEVVVSHLRKISDASETDSRYILATKFLLFYLFGKNPIVIKPTIHDDTCVICTKGKMRRIRAIQELLKDTSANEDDQHEAQYLCRVLKSDAKNDTCITVPSSILVYDKGKIGKKLCEFDGIVIFPTRKEKNIIFLEAKNTKEKQSFGKKCLIEKLEKLELPFSEDDIITEGKDSHFVYDVNES